VRSVSSVALQLLRGLEEILMKGATHNLVVRTRTDVALYVLNHKRGHLRDLENGFKVTLSVIADPGVSGPQAYVIDRSEQVHTLEAAKALLAAQAAASPPPQAEEAYDDEDGFDIETESEVETDETEGLADEQAAGESASEQDGHLHAALECSRHTGIGIHAGFPGHLDAELVLKIPGESLLDRWRDADSTDALNIRMSSDGQEPGPGFPEPATGKCDVRERKDIVHATGVMGQPHRPGEYPLL